MSEPPALSTALDTAEQMLDDRVDGLDLHFRFTVRGGDYRAHLGTLRGAPVLALTGRVGRLPFSAENPTARQMGFALARASKTFPNVDFHVDGDGTVVMRQIAVLPPPVGRKQALAKAVALIVQARAYLDFIDLIRR